MKSEVFVWKKRGSVGRVNNKGRDFWREGGMLEVPATLPGAESKGKVVEKESEHH